MAHDVFISYASPDKTTADALCATLESRGIRCWIAPRDALAGIPYPEQLIDAIEKSRIFVLVFSSSSNQSPQVMREVERAVHHAIPIIPMRVEDVPMSKNMEYFISAPHWLDALTPPLEKHLGHVADSVALLLQRRPSRSGESAVTVRPSVSAPEEPRRPAGPSRKLPRPAISAGVAALAALLLFLVARGLGLFARHGTDPAVRGTWTLAFRNAGVDFNLSWQIGADDYRLVTNTSDAGSFQLGPGRWRTVSRGGQVAGGALTSSGPDSVTMLGGPAGPLTWTRASPGSSGSGPSWAGTWKATAAIGGLEWRFTSVNTAGGRYTLEGSTEDDGRIEARDGRFKTVSKRTGAAVDGTYALPSGDRLSTTGPQGTAVWARSGR